MSVQKICQVRRRFDSQKRTRILECCSETRIPPLEEERIIEVCPAVCIIQHLSYGRQRITGLHSFAANHYRRILVMHTTEMCDPFVDISIVLMIQSTLVSGLLCLSLPILGTIQGTVRGSSPFVNILWNKCFVSMFLLTLRSNICPSATCNVIVTYLYTLC